MLDGCQLFQGCRDIDLREQRLYLFHAHPAGEQFGDLREHTGIFGETALIQTGRCALHGVQRLRRLIGILAVSLDGGVVSGELPGKVGQRVAGLLHAFVVPHGIDQLRQRLGVFLGSGKTALVVAGVQVVQRSLFLRAILHELDQGVLAVILGVDLRIDRSQPLGSGDHGVLVHGHIRILLTTGLGPGDLGLHFVENGLETLGLAVWLKFVLDDDSFPVVDKLLQADFLVIGQVPVLALLQQGFDLPVHAVEAVDVRLNLLGHAGVPGIFRCALQRLKLGAGGLRQGFPGIRPFPDDLIGFALAVRPDVDQAGHPGPGALCGVVILEVVLGHAEEGQPSAAPSIECVGSGILPFICRIDERLRGLPGHLRPGDPVPQLGNTIHYSRADGQPHGGRLRQYGEQTGHPATGFADSGTEGAQPTGQLAEPRRQPSEDQDHRPGGSGEGREPRNLEPLSLIHVLQPVDELAYTLHDPLNGGAEIIAQGLSKQNGAVLQVGESALERGIALGRHGFQRGVVLPCLGGHLLGVGKQLTGIGGAKQCVAQTYLGDADVVQGLDGGRAFVVHPSQALDELLEHLNRVVFPLLDEFLLCQPADHGKVLQGVAAGLGSNLHIDEGLGHGGTARLGLYAD